MKYFDIPFAFDGDKEPIPENPPVDDSVSYYDGWGSDYELPYDDPVAKDIDRKQMNQLFNEITGAIGGVQRDFVGKWDIDRSYTQDKVVLRGDVMWRWEAVTPTVAGDLAYEPGTHVSWVKLTDDAYISRWDSTKEYIFENLVHWFGKIYRWNDMTPSTAGDEPGVHASWQEITGGGGDASLTGVVAVEVPGDYATIGEALDYLTGHFPAYGLKASIEVADGHTISEQVIADGVDLSWIAIKSMGTVTVDHTALTKAVGGQYPAFCATNGGRLRVHGGWVVSGGTSSMSFVAAIYGEVYCRALEVTCGAPVCFYSSTQGVIYAWLTGTSKGETVIYSEYGASVLVLGGNLEPVPTGSANALAIHAYEGGRVIARSSTIGGAGTANARAILAEKNAYVRALGVVDVYGAAISSQSYAIKATGGSKIDLYCSGNGYNLRVRRTNGTTIIAEGGFINVRGSARMSCGSSGEVIAASKGSIVTVHNVYDYSGGDGGIRSTDSSKVVCYSCTDSDAILTGKTRPAVLASSLGVVEIIDSRSHQIGARKLTITSTSGGALKAESGGVIRIRNCDTITSTTGATILAESGGRVEVENVATKIECSGNQNAAHANGGDIVIRRAKLLKSGGASAIVCGAGSTMDISFAEKIEGKNSGIHVEGKIIARNCGTIKGNTQNGITASQAAHVDISASGNITGGLAGISADGSTIVAQGVGNISGGIGVNATNGACIDVSCSGNTTGSSTGIYAINSEVAARKCGNITGENNGIWASSASKIDARGCGSITGTYDSAIICTGGLVDASNASGIIGDSSGQGGNGYGIYADRGEVIARSCGGIIGGSKHGIFARNGRVDASNASGITGAVYGVYAEGSTLTASGTGDIVGDISPTGIDVYAKKSRVEIQDLNSSPRVHMSTNSLVLAGGTTTSGVTPNTISGDGLLLA